MSRLLRQKKAAALIGEAWNTRRSERMYKGCKLVTVGDIPNVYIYGRNNLFLDKVATMSEALDRVNKYYNDEE